MTPRNRPDAYGPRAVSFTRGETAAALACIRVVLDHSGLMGVSNDMLTARDKLAAALEAPVSAPNPQPTEATDGP